MSEHVGECLSMWEHVGERHVVMLEDVGELSSNVGVMSDFIDLRDRKSGTSCAAVLGVLGRIRQVLVFWQAKESM
jgi:hypothetical protein